MMKTKFNGTKMNIIIIFFVIVTIMLSSISFIWLMSETDFVESIYEESIEFKDSGLSLSDPNPNPGQDNPSPNDYTTKPELKGMITIEGIDKFAFDPNDVTSVRADIFKSGYFSLFDVLIYLDSNNEIDLEYHFDESMNTNVIDSINGQGNWWYFAFYSGGWRENNAFRMDHYPYKDNTTITLFQESPQVIDDIYQEFKSEIARRASNDDRVIIQEVVITAPKTNLRFSNVEVSAHNLRNDTFQDGVITAIDVIMSLGDQGKLTYDLKWYETIALATPVKNYWVERINKDKAYDTCGFVYEAGSFDFQYSRNHIHIPSDSRVINSPEYEEWFWICL